MIAFRLNRLEKKQKEAVYTCLTALMKENQFFFILREYLSILKFKLNENINVDYFRVLELQKCLIMVWFTSVYNPAFALFSWEDRHADSTESKNEGKLLPSSYPGKYHVPKHSIVRQSDILKIEEEYPMGVNLNYLKLYSVSYFQTFKYVKLIFLYRDPIWEKSFLYRNSWNLYNLFSS